VSERDRVAGRARSLIRAEQRCAAERAAIAETRRQVRDGEIKVPPRPAWLDEMFSRGRPLSLPDPIEREMIKLIRLGLCDDLIGQWQRVREQP
jgi:hypothetical protein